MKENFNHLLGNSRLKNQIERPIIEAPSGRNFGRQNKDKSIKAPSGRHYLFCIQK